MTHTKPTPRTDALSRTLNDFPKTEEGRIAWQQEYIDLCYQLERELAAIKSQPVPVEPKRYDCESTGWDRTDFDMVEHEDGRYVEYTDYDSLQSALQVAQMERTAERERGDQWETTATNLLERAEKAEADNQRLRKDRDEHARWWADLADKFHDLEASNKRLVELLNDASGVLKVYSNRHTDCRGPLVDYCITCDTQKRIDAELLREVGK